MGSANQKVRANTERVLTQQNNNNNKELIEWQEEPPFLRLGWVWSGLAWRARTPDSLVVSRH